MWAEEFTRYLKRSGFTQSIVDRRLFYMSDEEGRALLLGMSVNNCTLVVQSAPLATRFNEK